MLSSQASTAYTAAPRIFHHAAHAMRAMPSAGPAMRLQQMLRGQRLPPIPHLLSVMVQPKPVSRQTGALEIHGLLYLGGAHALCYLAAASQCPLLILL